MGALLLDSKNRLIHDEIVFRGGVSSASVQPGPVLRIAVLDGAAALVLYHNHPSGDPTPSPEDRATTVRFVAAGDAVGVPGPRPRRRRAGTLVLVPPRRADLVSSRARSGPGWG